MIRWTRLAAACAFAALSSAAVAAPAELTIMAPAAPGGGWDQTARSMQSVLQEAGIVGNVQVVNVPGAGGTIGLAQFVNDDKGNATKLIVGGYVMVGAIIANKSPVSLADVTPLARLTGEYDAIVVPKNSPIQSMADLVEKLKADPGSVSWAGGSAGGVDHIAVGLIAKAVGVDPTRINYIPFSGGGEALAAILGGQVTAGISGYGEFEGQVKAGELRLLALTGGPDGPDTPTLKSQGIDVDVQNWRMVAAAPGITDAEKADLVATITAMANSDQWKAVLAAKGWQNTFLAGDEFSAYLDGQVKATTEVLKDVGIAQ
ncbi:MAG TPA: tripartite tricarboxylate transporter substrate binding protein [Bauldia sp.]|nr:tripartite tricarboxylate transporter substrate binding protein [Bauldia sp.]